MGTNQFTEIAPVGTRRQRWPVVSLMAVSVAVALAMVVLAVTGCASGPTETRDDTFTVSGVPRIIVKSGNGFIRLNTSGTGNTVRVEATLRDAPRVEYEVSQDGDTITIEAKTQRGWTIFRHNPKAEITITAPAMADIDFDTSNGDVEAAGVEGSGRIHTSNGKIVLRNMKGDFDGRTSNGDLDVDTVEGTVTLETSNGDVVVHGLKGEVDVNTSNGRISISGEIVPGGHNRLSTSNGDVDVTFLGTASVNLDASTSNGKVESDIPVETTTFGSKRIVGKIGNGDADLYIRTSNGDVRIR